MRGNELKPEGYDIIGDVHGQTQQLVNLLSALGYGKLNGVWSHPSRQALFVGDVIDKGQDPAGALSLVHDMVTAGSARMVLGNHELNWIHEAADYAGDPWSFLAATARRAEREALAWSCHAHPEWLLQCFHWLRRQPIFIDEPDLRVVHAWWDGQAVQRLHHAGINDLDEAALSGYRTPHQPLYYALDRVIAGCAHKALAKPSPEGFSTRRRRINWWEEVVPDGDNGYPAEDPPVFFGHYAMEGPPRLLSPNQLSVDYGAAYGGHLVAYRHTPGEALDESRFVAA